MRGFRRDRTKILLHAKVCGDAPPRTHAGAICLNVTCPAMSSGTARGNPRASSPPRPRASSSPPRPHASSSPPRLHAASVMHASSPKARGRTPNDEAELQRLRSTATRAVKAEAAASAAKHQLDAEINKRMVAEERVRVAQRTREAADRAAADREKQLTRQLKAAVAHCEELGGASARRAFDPGCRRSLVKGVIAR